MTTAEFDAYADSYRHAVARSIGFAGQEVDFYARRKASALIDLARRRLGDPRDLRVLDVGCGVGITDRFLAGDVGSLLGVDTSPEAVERAARLNPSVEYSAYDGGRLPYEDGGMDIAFAICVFHHVDPSDRPHLTGELRRVVRPGGLVVLFEHNPVNPLTRVAVSRCDFDEAAILMTRGEAARTLSSAGLTPVERRYIIFLPFERPRVAALERALAWLPAGAQHYVAAER